MKRATITVTLVVDFEDGEDPKEVLAQALHRSMYDDFEAFDGRLHAEIIEPHVDAVEEVE